MRLLIYLSSNLVLMAYVSTMLSSCNKDEDFPDTYEHFIFGIYHCECVGKCATLYRIADETLEYSTETSCLPQNHVFPDSLLTPEQYQIALKLIEEFPDDLLEESENTYGCPDCADQGGFYLELKSEGGTRTWNIDTQEDGLPDFIKGYSDVLRDVMMDLQ